MFSRLHRALAVDRVVHARHVLHAACDWDHVERLAARMNPQLVVFDPYASGQLEMARYAAFCESYRSVVLLPYGDIARVGPRDLLRLAEMGVREVLIRDRDDRPAGLYRLLSRMFSAAAESKALDELGDAVPPNFQAFFLALVAAAVAPMGPTDAARLYRRHANTLREHLRAAGFPPINKMIVWARLFQAAHLLEDPARSGENVALALGFPSASALRNQFNRYVQMSLGEVRAQGGVRVVARAFTRSLAPEGL